MTDVVLISLEAWDEVWRRNQHLTAGLLRADPALRMLFVEPACDPLHALRRRQSARRGRGLRPGPRLPGVGRDRLWLYEPTKWLPRRLRPSLDRGWAAGVVRAARRLHLDVPVLWVNSPSGAHVLERTGWPGLYDITDDWLAAPRTLAEHQRLAREEALLLEQCQEVVVCSPALQGRKSARRVTLIPNAVDVEAYRSTPARPGDLPLGRVAVYVGTLHADRLDVGLCARTAESLRPDGRLVLVGPDLLAHDQHVRLADAGALFLGAKPVADVPGYLLHADVLVVPHVVGSFTDSLDPIKAYEYRAAARPVVATPVAGFREQRAEGITVAEGAAFVEAVRHGLVSPRTMPRDALEDVPTWSQRVAQMATVIERLDVR